MRKPIRPCLVNNKFFEELQSHNPTTFIPSYTIEHNTMAIQFLGSSFLIIQDKSGQDFFFLELKSLDWPSFFQMSKKKHPIRDTACGTAVCCIELKLL